MSTGLPLPTEGVDTLSTKHPGRGRHTSTVTLLPYTTDRSFTGNGHGDGPRPIYPSRVVVPGCPTISPFWNPTVKENKMSTPVTQGPSNLTNNLQCPRDPHLALKGLRGPRERGYDTTRWSTVQVWGRVTRGGREGGSSVLRRKNRKPRIKPLRKGRGYPTRKGTPTQEQRVRRVSHSESEYQSKLVRKGGYRGGERPK